MMKTSTLKLFRILLLFIGGSCAMAVPPNPMLGMRISTGSTPVIDGRIADGEWDDAAKLPPFIKVESTMPRWDKLNDVMLKYDSGNLYIGFRTYMSIDMDLAPQTGDSLAMTQVESFDIRLIKEGQPKWRRFVVERGGRKLDQLIRGHIHDAPSEWNPQWEYKCTLTPMDFSVWSIWEGEIAIPWSTLEISEPADGSQLSAMFIRYLGTAGTAEGCRTASWNLAANDVDLVFDANYGALVFSPDKNVFRCDSIDTYSRCRAAISGKMVGTGAEKGGTINSAVWDAADSKRFFDTAEYSFNGSGVNWEKHIKIKQAEKCSGRIYVFDSEGAAICKYPFINTMLPGFYANALWDSMRDTVSFQGESLDGFLAGDEILFRLTAKDGTIYLSESVPADNIVKGFDHTVCASGIPAGTVFNASAALLRDGEIVNESVFELTKEFPVWAGTAEKYTVTAPPAGWEKVVYTRQDDTFTASIRDNSYIFKNGMMPEKILLRGEEFSDGKWEFMAETSNGKQNFVCRSLTAGNQDDRGVTLNYSGESEDLTLDAVIRIEFDGLAWYECTVAPKNAPVEIKRISLQCPIRPHRLRYMWGNSYNSSANTSFALIGKARRSEEIITPAVSFNGGYSFNGWQFTDSFKHFYWICGDDRGVLFVLPSTRNMAVAGNYNKVTDTAEEFRFELELVNTPTLLSKPVEYTFGTVLTPARRAIDPAGLRRVGSFCRGLKIGEEHSRSLIYDTDVITRESIGHRFFRPETDTFEIDKNFIYADMVASWIMRDVQDGKFIPDDKTRDEIRRETAGIRSGNHGKPLLWYDLLVTSQEQPREEWYSAPYTSMLGDVQVVLTCAASAWPDAYLYGLQERIKDGVASVYLDLSGWRTCTNRLHGCGYYNASGEVEAELPFLAQREFMLTLQKMLKENDKDGIIVYHGTSSMNIWSDLHIECEYWQYAPDYNTMSPEFYQLQMMGRDISGSMPCFYAVLLYRHIPGCQKSSVTQEDVLGFTLVHGQHCYSLHDVEVYGNYITTKPLLDFGVDDPDSQWIPYWKNPRSGYPETSLAVSSWKKGDRELMVIFNFSAAESAVFDPGCKVIDRLKGKGEITGPITIAPRKLFILETCGE